MFTGCEGKGKDNLLDYIFNLSQMLKNERRNSLSKNYYSLLRSLRSFTDKDCIDFNEVNKEFVLRYARCLKQSGITDSTQSFYLRVLRSVLNKAGAEGLVGDSTGWFNEVNTSIYFPAKGVDIRLDRNLLLKIESLDLSGNELHALVRDMFMFGFYCGGMELVDIANLTAENVKDGLLSFRRRLKGNLRKVVLCDSALRILKRYCNTADSTHLFPFIDKFPNVLFSTLKNYESKSIKEIGRLIGFPKLSFGMNVTAYKSLVSNINIPELLLHDIRKS